MKVTAAQLTPVFLNKDKTVAKAIKAIKDRFNEAVDTSKNFDAKANMNQQLEMAKKMGLEITDAVKEQANVEHEEKMKKTPNAFDNSVEVDSL